MIFGNFEFNDIKSEVLTAIFKYDMEGNLQNTVEIIDIRYGISKALFQYLYCRNINDIEEILKKHFIATKYALKKLKTTYQVPSS